MKYEEITKKRKKKQDKNIFIVVLTKNGQTPNDASEARHPVNGMKL